MKLSVIPEDRLIIKDNVSLFVQEDWPFDDTSIRAIQWDGDSGEVEYHILTWITLLQNSLQ